MSGVSTYVPGMAFGATKRNVVVALAYLLFLAIALGQISAVF